MYNNLVRASNTVEMVLNILAIVTLRALDYIGHALGFHCKQNGNKAIFII